MASHPESTLDVVIVGAGTAGLAALREVRKRTDSFVLVNEPPYGTTCVRAGCMPSKALIAAADAFHARTGFHEFGIRGGDALSADIPAVLERVRALRDHFLADVIKTTDELGERNVAGRARLDGPERVVVGDRVFRARQVILAPGSSPIVPGPWRALGERILTTDSLFEQQDLPRRIGVVGLGAIGVEMAQALARLGIEVHGFDAGGKMAGLSDDEVAEVLREALSADFAIHLDTHAELDATDGGVEMRFGGERVVVDKVLAAMGREPNVEGLGLETLGVPLDDHGLPSVDPETMRIADTPVLLAGDGNAAKPLLHEAADEGHIAGLNATSDGPVRLRRRTPLTIAFCEPQVAVVGERRADLDPSEVLFGGTSFASQGRARTIQRNEGAVRVYAARDGGLVLGAEMAVPAGEHLAHLLALAIGERLTVQDLLRMPFYHPTLEEGLRTALRSLAEQLPPCSASDLAGCGPLGAEALH